MAAVIRAAQVHNEPVLLATQRRPVALQPQLSALSAPLAARAGAPYPATLEAELRRQVTQEIAGTQGVGQGVAQGRAQDLAQDLAQERANSRDHELDQARARVLQQARDEGSARGLEEGLAAGLEQGLEQGLEEGREQGRAEWAERVAELDSLLASTHSQFQAGIAGHEDAMIELAFEAVGKIVGQALASREGVAAVVRQALQAVRERERLVIRLAPRDVEMVSALHGEFTRLAGAKALEVVADERVEWGGCLIETSGGGLDGRLETQLQRLRDVLLEARAAAEAGA